MDALIQFYHQWSHLVTIVAILVVVFIINRIIHTILAGLANKATVTRHPWRHAMLMAPDAPLRAIIWISALSAIFNILVVISPQPLLQRLFPPLRDVIAICVIAWALFRLVNRVKHNLIDRAKSSGDALDLTATDAISKLCWSVIFVLTVLVIMQTLGFSIAGLLAFGGAAGIAIGFAAQNLVSNLFGGITIFASRIFKIGEYIIIPGTGLMGEVKHIGWRSTLVMGFNRKPFYVPNSLFNTSSLINHSRMDRRCIEQYVHVRYEDMDKVEGIVREVNELIANDPGIDQEFFVFQFSNYSESTLKMFLYAFTLSTSYVDYMKMTEKLLLEIGRIIRRHGAQLAKPASSVYFPEGTPLSPAAEQIEQSAVASQPLS